MTTFDFLHIGVLDILDIILVAILLYYVYKLVKGTVAIQIFMGIAFIFLIYKITLELGLKMFSGILGALLGVGTVGIMIVFQQEIRKFLLMMGSAKFTGKHNFIRQWKFFQREIHVQTDTDTLVDACVRLGNSKTGALIVMERTNRLDFLYDTGDKINAAISIPILESIFYKNSPLHDGAVIIRNNQIVATRVVLPLSQKEIPKHFGLRHLAAIGITERTDAVCLVVSEQTGKISLISDGDFVLYEDTDDLKRKLTELLA